MALYRIKTFKHCNAFGGEAWENVYTVSVTGGPEDTEAIGDAIVVCERAVSYDTISFDGFATYPNGPGEAVFKKQGYIGQGDLDSTGLGGILPLFNTVRVTFYNALGRPEIKYLRLGANANNIGSGSWDGEFVDAVTADYMEPMLGNLEYVGPNGEAHIGGQVLADVQMRQLHWHRRERVGYHRGWVPN